MFNLHEAKIFTRKRKTHRREREKRQREREETEREILPLCDSSPIPSRVSLRQSHPQSLSSAELRLRGPWIPRGRTGSTSSRFTGVTPVIPQLLGFFPCKFEFFDDFLIAKKDKISSCHEHLV